MKNNVLALIFHILIIFILFIVNLLISLNSTISNLIYGNMIFKIILIVFTIFLYYNFAKLMSKRRSKRLDFLTGNIIVVVAIILLIPPLIMLGFKMFDMNVSENLWKFPLDFFLMPGLLISRLLGFKYGIISLVFASLLPGFIYGISIKKSRNKIIRQNRVKRMRQRRNI